MQQPLANANNTLKTAQERHLAIFNSNEIGQVRKKTKFGWKDIRQCGNNAPR